MEGEKTTTRAVGLDARSGLSHAAIRQQLDRILIHGEFQATDRMRDFLRFVVEETLAGRMHRIKGYTIATCVFGRDDDFDPAQDPIVSIQAGRLRRALERYYLVAGGRDPVHIDIPKGRYVPRFTAQYVAHDGERPNGSLSTADDPRLPDGPSIAVLPLENLTGDPEQRPLTIGLTEELVTEMNRFQDLVIISTHRAPPGAGVPTDPVDLATAAGARFVLQGAVRMDAKTVKVSARLVDVKSGLQVWAEAYTHPLDAGCLIATQEEIARSVAAAIGSEYGIIARRLAAESRKKPPAELDTYEAILRFYAHQFAPKPDSSETCFAALHRAVEREPEYGPAWSALANLYCQMYIFAVPGFEEPLKSGLECARRGVTLEPGAQLCHLVLAYACYLAEDAACFHQEAETALGLNPNSPYSVGAIGYLHALMGELDRGLPLIDRAIAMNPYYPAWFHTGHLIAALDRRDWEGALRVLEQHNPAHGHYLPVVYAATLAKLGRTEEAKPYLEQLQKQRPDFGPRAWELLHRTIKVDVIVDDLVDGLRLAGMTVGDP